MHSIGNKTGELFDMLGPEVTIGGVPPPVGVLGRFSLFSGGPFPISRHRPTVFGANQRGRPICEGIVGSIS